MDKIIALAAIALFFLVTPTPEITSFTPPQSLNTETVTMIIDGAKFDQSASVKLSRPGKTDIYPAQVKVESKNRIVCRFDLRGQEAGEWDLIVANTDRLTGRLKQASPPPSFRIEYPAPVIESINPRQGLNSGVIKIDAVKGANFRPGVAVMLSNDQMEIGASEINLISGSQLTCRFNLLNVPAGSYHVKVINDDGKTAILPNAFVVQGPPKNILPPEIAAITPERGFNNGYILTAISGANFKPEAVVKLAGQGVELTALNVKLESSSKITCFFDIKDRPVGVYSVEIINPDGRKGILTDAFTIETMDASAIKLNSSLKPIFFDLNRDGLKPGQPERLDANLKILTANPKLFILLGGHADERGGKQYNLDLSARRAETVKKYLVDKGIDPDRITIYAYGKDHPAKKGRDESSWQYNRRVDVMVWEEPPTREMGLKGIE
ncbi:MAG: OmpA family protein [Firmicutes bacterium]|nr:OmpA family protein [Bacillota bacterium]